MSLDIISLGEPMLEFSAIAVGRLADVPAFQRGWGGDTSNFAVAAARLGARVGYVTRLGNDEFGRCFLDLWRREGIDVSRVAVDPDGFTGIYFISLLADGGHDFTYYRSGSAASRLRPQDLDLEFVAAARLLHVSGITQAISRSACDASFAAMEAAHKAGRLVSYDPNVRLKLWSRDTARAIVDYTFGLADIVLPSLEEASWILGRDRPESIVDALLEKGARIVALKLGADGCIVGSRQDGILQVAGFQVPVVETTGAGDAFDAAFALGILQGQAPRDAALFANAVGALTCTGAGAVAPIPNREQVLSLLARQASEVRQFADERG